MCSFYRQTADILIQPALILSHQVAAGDAATMLPAIADLAKGSAVLKNLVVLVTGVDANVVEGWDAVVVASDNGEVFRPTLLAAGALRNSAEQSGGIVHVGELGRDLADVDSGRTLPRARAYQLLALALALDATAGMTLAAYQYPAATAVAAAAPYAEGEFAEYAEENTVEAGAEATAQTVLEDTLRDVKVESRLVRSIREVGLTPLMELGVLAGGGVAVSLGGMGKVSQGVRPQKPLLYVSSLRAGEVLGEAFAVSERQGQVRHL